MTRFGHTCALSSESIREKVKQTMLDRYGVENYFLDPDNQQSIIDDRFEKFGYRNVGERNIPDATRKVLADKDLFIAAAQGKNFEMVARALQVSAETISNYADKYDIRHLMKLGSGSSIQAEIFEWISELNFKVIYNDRSVIAPKELDLFFPDFNLAVEYNGIFYHSEISGGKDQYYHLHKLMRCEDKGIKLIHIHPWHYNHYREVVKGIILSKLNGSIRIDMSECSVVELEKDIADSFFESNCFQEKYNHEHVRIGLICNGVGVLMQVISLNQSSKNNWIIERFANKVGYEVSDGVAAIFDYFMNTYAPDYIEGNIDIRYFTGQCLATAGFTLSEYIEPAAIYHYNYRTSDILSDNIREFLKDNQFNLIDLDHEKIRNLGIDRIWDCGKAKWVWQPEQKVNTSFNGGVA